MKDMTNFLCIIDLSQHSYHYSSSPHFCPLFPLYNLIMKQQQHESSLKFQIIKAPVSTDYATEDTDSKAEIPFNPLFCGLALTTKLIPIIFFFTLSEFKILDFTFVLLSAAVDFWLVKNIAGRKLVGMTWWMKINEETGEETWIFHSTDSQNISGINYNVFWACNLGSAIFWGFATLLSILISRLFWISICAVCLILSSINFIFYLRCRGNHQEKFKGMVDKMGIQSAHALVGEY